MNNDTNAAHWDTDRATLLEAAELLGTYDRGCVQRMLELVGPSGFTGDVSEAITIRYTAFVLPEGDLKAKVFAIADRIQGV